MSICYLLLKNFHRFMVLLKRYDDCDFVFKKEKRNPFRIFLEMLLFYYGYKISLYTTLIGIYGWHVKGILCSLVYPLVTFLTSSVMRPTANKLFTTHETRPFCFVCINVFKGKVLFVISLLCFSSRSFFLLCTHLYPPR